MMIESSFNLVSRVFAGVSFARAIGSTDTVVSNDVSQGLVLPSIFRKGRGCDAGNAFVAPVVDKEVFP